MDEAIKYVARWTGNTRSNSSILGLVPPTDINDLTARTVKQYRMLYCNKGDDGKRLADCPAVVVPGFFTASSAV